MTAEPGTTDDCAAAAAERRPRRHAGARRVLGMTGPALVAAVAYVDPGNFATNVAAGSTYGYALVWVVIVASLMAVPVQYTAATVGVVTGRSLPEECAGVMGRRARVLMWLQAELVAMATDVAEFIGAAVGLHLVFGLALLPSGLITAVIAFGILALQRRGHRPFELAIVAFLAFVVLAFVVQLVAVGVDAAGLVDGLVPSLPGGAGGAEGGALLIAVGIVGATVMPHAVYAHSALAARRAEGAEPGALRRLMRFQRTEVVGALALAGLVNVAILLVAARVFAGVPDLHVTDGLADAHRGLAQLAGGGVALAFAAALLASGLSSAAVGTFSGQVVMAGFVSVHIPLVVRRSLTMLPALVLLGLGVSPTIALVGSQVVLSFGIPFALWALLRVVRDRRSRGQPVVGRGMTAVLMLVSAVVVVLNVVLLVDTVTP